MFTAYDKLNNTFSMGMNSFTSAGASFGISVKMANHTNPAHLGEWGNGATYLTSMKGASNAMNNGTLIQLVPVHHGRVIPFAIENSPYEMKYRTEYGDICCCFAEPTLLLIKGENNLGLKIEKSCGEHGVIRKRGQKGWELTEALISCFVFYPQIGEIAMDSKWELERMSTPLIRGEVVPAEDGTFAISIEETEDLGYVRESYPTYEEGLAAAKASWEEFYGKIAPEGGEKTADEAAAYTLWSMLEQPSGRLKNSIIHTNYTNAAPTWTTCLITAALKNDLPLALELLLSQLDQQEPNGEIPSLFDHTNRDCLNAGLPLQGWALNKLMEANDFKAEVPEETLKALYEGYSKWADWFLKYRDDDEDGIPQTEGSVEAGCVDSPIFKYFYVVELPEVCAYLTLLNEKLADLAGMLGLEEEQAVWKMKAEEYINKTLAFWNGERFVGRDHYTGAMLNTESLQFYRPLVLGKRLPEQIVEIMAEDLTVGNGYLVKGGLLSQRMTSKDYSKLSVNGGSILAADNLMIIDGLMAAGKEDLAKEIAAMYVKGVGKGFADAETAAAYFVLKEIAK